MAVIYIVDENDAVIDVKERSQVKCSDINRTSALWLTNSKGEILLAQRSSDKYHDPEKWGPAVAGTVEDGETYEQNIIKEIEEELGITDIKVIEGPKIFCDKEQSHFVKWFVAELNWELEQFKVQQAEVKAIRWISKEDLIEEFSANPDSFIRNADRYINLFCC